MSTATLTSLLEFLYGTLTPSNMRWLGEHLIEQAEKSEEIKPYTMEEINAMIEESERDFEAGRCYSTEEVLQMSEAEISQMHVV